MPVATSAPPRPPTVPPAAATAADGDRSRFPLPSSRALGIAAAVTLLGGYADLIRGGVTLAPLLLVIGYCVLIPAALWQASTRPMSRSGTATAHPSYIAAALAGLAIFGLYVVTLAPGTAMWDTSEYMAAAYTMGLPHPPGNPLFVLLGRVFSLLPIAPTVAMRINVLAALCSAASAAMWFLVAERVTAGWLPQRWQRLAVGALAVLIGGTAFTVWNQSVVNEKVYTVSLVGLAVISWLMVRWSDDPDGPRADRVLLVVAYLLGLGYANHIAGMLAAPAVGFAVAVRRPRTLLRWKLLLACAGALLVGVTPFATQPIRAAFNPPLNEGEPTACRSGLAVSCTFSKKTWDAFRYNLNREQYGKPELTERQAPFTAQVGMYWLYFRWQWLRDVYADAPRAQALLASFFLITGLLGGWAHFRRERQSFWYFGGLTFLMSLGLVYYLNFKYGASQDPDLAVPHEVRDRDYFFLWSFSAWGVWAALGIAYLWESLVELTGGKRATVGLATAGRWRLAGVGAPLLAIACIPLFANWTVASRRNDIATLAFAHDLLNSVEPYGILVTGGDNDTFPLWYAQEVEGIRKDVTVAVLSLMNTDWFARGIIRRPIFEYDAAKGPAIYRGREWPKPTGPPINMTLAQADSLDPYMILRDPVVFRRPGIEATIDPRNLMQVQGGGLLEQADMLVLRMIADSWPSRPIYISRTTGSYPQRMGLESNTLSQGLARKVVPTPTNPGADTVFLQGDGWFDVATTKALFSDVFQGPDAIIRQGQWVDRPSLSTPLSYLIAGSELVEVMRARGDNAGAAKIGPKLAEVAQAIRLAPDLRAALGGTVFGDTAR